MSATLVVTRLAVRELWITFGFLVLLAAYVGVGAFVALLPAGPSTTVGRMAVGFGAATAVAAAVAAASLGRHRQLGRAGWIVTHSVSRGTLLAGWFLATGSVAVVGVAAAGALGWLSLAPPLSRLQVSAFVAAMVGVAALSLAACAVGLATAALLRPWVAMFTAVVLVATGIGVGYLLLPPDVLPLSTLAELTRLPKPLASAVRAAGIGFAATGVALVVARLALARTAL